MTRIALVVVDLQNDFCHPDGVFHRAGLRLEDLDGLVERVNVLTRAARTAGHLVLWTRMVWDDDAALGLLAERSPFLATEGLRRGSWGAELLDGLQTDADDVVLDKTRFSSFYGTDLERLLGERGIGTLVVAGVRTDFCVESTVRDAFFRDMRVVVVRPAVAGYIPALHEHSLALMGTVFAQVVDADEALHLLGETTTQKE